MASFGTVGTFDPPTSTTDKNHVTPPDKNVAENNIYINTKRKLLKEKSAIVVGHLNEKISADYSSTSEMTLNQLETLFDNGYSVEDVTKVIDNKVTEWKGTSYERYLRPATLFGKNFDNYLNDKPYAVITPKKEEILEHDYSKEQLNSVLTSIDDLEIL